MQQPLRELIERAWLTIVQRIVARWRVRILAAIQCSHVQQTHAVALIVIKESAARKLVPLCELRVIVPTRHLFRIPFEPRSALLDR